MGILDKLERKFGHLAIKGLMGYIVGLNVLVYLLMLSYPTGIVQWKLMMDPDLVLRGEVWRLVTYVFIPPEASPIWIIFILYFYYMIGAGLEQEWGSFKFNVYYLLGMAGTSIVAFLLGVSSTPIYLNLSLFLAFARIFPDYEILLFFVLPVKVKYLAWLDWFFIAYTVVFQSVELKLAAVISIINFFMFFGRDIVGRTKTSRQVHYNRKRFNTGLPKDFTIHKCTICGITEKDDPKMDFRYCGTCEGDYEYCMNHLKAHEHIKKNNLN